MYNRIIKPISDFIFSLLLLLLLCPLILSILVILMLKYRGHPFFFQARGGINGAPFSIIKFKTMNNNLDENGHLLPDSLRLSRIGRYLRKYSLDELPQLINIIKGDLSFVGPRPLPVQYLSHYTEEQFRRHEVKPGITGWAQINGRQSISFSKRFELDCWYIENVSFLLDFRIFFRTLQNVIKSKDIIEDEQLWEGQSYRKE